MPSSLGKSKPLRLFVPTTITQSLGDRVVDISIIPYMRNKGVLFTGSDFKPNTVLYPFFDSTSVEKYVARANKFIISTNNLQYRTQVGNPELVNVSNTTTSTTNGTAYIVRTTNNEGFVISVTPNASSYLSGTFSGSTMNLVGQSTGTTYKINGYEHYSGIAGTPTNSSLILSADAYGANNISSANLVGQPISIVSGTGAGQQATISAYDAATRNVTITGTWTTTPVASNSVYSIGLAGRYKLTSNKGITFEYNHQLNMYENLLDKGGNIVNYKPDLLSLGMEFGTGGHLFQFYIGNTTHSSNIDQLARNTSGLFENLAFGFTINRSLSLSK